MNFLEGKILAFDKPYRQTSFKLVSHVRWLLTRGMGGRKLRVGHAGTLDPLATGVLVVCTGRATGIIEQLQGHDKEYVAELRLGETTASYDLEHPVDKTYPTEHITEQLLCEVLAGFTGDIMQVPPAFSACNIDGKRAYELARKGREVKLQAKPIHIESIEIEELRLPDYVRLRIQCGKGTYIRSLARDIGEALGSGAHLLSLRRTRVGNISVEQCWTMEEFENWIEKQQIDSTPPEGPRPKEYPMVKKEN